MSSCHEKRFRESAVSEIVGATLLISVVVISVAVISVMVLSPGTPQKIPALNAVISNIDRNVYIYHDGGDTLQNGEIAILVNGQDKTSSFSKSGATDWKTWSVGESLAYTAPGTDPISDVKIIYTSGTAKGLLANAQFGPSGMPTEVPVIYPAVAAFSGSPTTQYVGFPVSFTDLSANNPTSWFWDFGDGTNSTDRNPAHLYAATGTYTVSLTATNAVGGSTEIKSNYITITPPPPLAAFTGTPLSGTVPLTVVFTDASTNGPTSWSWDFGDGDNTNATVQSPVHRYTTTGTFNVTLTVTNAYGSNATTKVNYVTVVPKAPVASFTGIPFWGLSPLPVQYTDTSINNPTSWLWDFGDGDGTNATVQNPLHRYTAMGSYNVSLTATNAGGSNKTTYTNYITVGKYVQGWRARYYRVEQSWAQENLVFTNNPSRIHFANNIAITNYSYLSSDVPNWPYPYLGYTEYYSCQFDGFIKIDTPGTYTFYMWSDDGAVLTIDDTKVIDDNTLHSPTQDTGSVYLTAGYHPINVKQWNHAEASVISLEYSGPGISRTYVTNVWRITAVDPPVADFSATPTSGIAPLAVSFTDLSSTGANHPTTWSWSFGDGDITGQTQQNPVHTYASSGTYTVSLTATNDGGSSTMTKTGYITITPAPTITSITPSSGNRGWPVSISNLAGTGFQSGATVKLARSGYADIVATNVVVSSSTKITCTFDLNGAAAGSWNVVVTNPDGQSGTLTSGFSVNSPRPTINGDLSPYRGYTGDTITASFTGTGFQPGASVTLTDYGTTIPSTSVVVNSPTSITFTFTIPNDADTYSWYDLIVTNTDSQTRTRTDEFYVRG